MAQMPEWLEVVSFVSLGLGVVCALAIAFDVAFVHRQKMWIMNIVWPITALYGSLLALLAYRRIGLLSAHSVETGDPLHPEDGKKKQFWQKAGLAATHCGSGCTLGDIVAEAGFASLGVTILGSELLGSWTLDYVFAFLFGIAFQYFTIVPMRHLSFGRGLVAALKADALSLTAWQVGMYGWMAVVIFPIFGHRLPVASPVFWFMMQIAMLFGLLTSYPVNRWLLRTGIKEAM